MVETRRSSASFSNNKRLSSSPPPSSSRNPKRSKAAAAAAAAKDECDQKKESLVPVESPNTKIDSGAVDPPKEAGDVRPTEKKQQLAAPPTGFPAQVNTDHHSVKQQLILPLNRRNLQRKQRLGKALPDTGIPWGKLLSQSSEDLTGSFLTHLYDFLVKFSPNGFLQQDGIGGAIPMYLSNQCFTTKITYTDIICLSNLLLEVLQKQFKRLLSGITNLPSVVISNENGHLTLDAKFSPEEFLLLLRCSMIIMHFLEFDLTLVLERCQILVTLLGKICSPNLPLKFPRHSTHHVDAGTPDAGISTYTIFAVLEVFLDELLMHHELRKFFIMSDSASATEEKLFLSHCSHDGVQAIMELVSNHFLLSVHDELASDGLLGSLFWSKEGNDQSPALGLESALKLLCFPVIFSAPHLLQAHLILLVSRCIGIHIHRDAKNLDVLVLDLYILAFELSVKFYSGFMPILNFFDCTIGDERESSFGATGLSFNSCIRSLTCDKLRQQVNRLIGGCHLPAHGLYTGSKAEIVDNYTAYIKESLNFVDEKFRDKACSILTYIVESVLMEERKLLHEDGGSIQQAIYCVAAALKLMSSSLLQIVWFLRQNDPSGDMGISKQHFICKVHEFISGIVRCFGNYGGDRHDQRILLIVMETAAGGHEETKMIFSHFVSLLSYSFRKKVDFLSKGCIFMMISLLNLLISEEGNLDAFRPLPRERQGPTSTQAKNLKDLFYRPSSIVIASNLEKVRNRIKHLQAEDHKLGGMEITEMETSNCESNAPNILLPNSTGKHDTLTYKADSCSGDIFLKLLPGFHSNHPDWEDLADFIVCDHKKDYSTWLQKQGRFRNWRYGRMRSLKHKSKRDRRKKRRGPLSCKGS